jgi:hypothetical protein
LGGRLKQVPYPTLPRNESTKKFDYPPNRPTKIHPLLAAVVLISSKSIWGKSFSCATINILRTIYHQIFFERSNRFGKILGLFKFSNRQRAADSSAEFKKPSAFYLQTIFCRCVFPLRISISTKFKFSPLAQSSIVWANKKYFKSFVDCPRTKINQGAQ